MKLDSLKNCYIICGILAITRRKLAKPVSEIMAAVHRFDLAALPQDHVDILMPIVPTADEVQQYKEYAAKNDDSFDALTVEDQFLAQLMNIERLSQKLLIMSFMAGFEESYNLLLPVSCWWLCFVVKIV